MWTIVTILNICLSLSDPGKLPKVIIQDADILKAIVQYHQYIQKEGFDIHGTQNLLLRIDKTFGEKIIFISRAGELSEFIQEGDLPNNYSEYKGRLIFIYDEKAKVDDGSYRFENFYDQFGFFLAKDVLRNKTPTPGYMPTGVMDITTWRVDLSRTAGKNNIKGVRLFPKPSFYKRYKYDERGYLMGLDGVYENAAAGPTIKAPKGFDLRKYLLQNTLLPYDSLKNATVSAEIVFNESGCVMAAKIEGLKSEKFIKEAQNGLRKMPCWIPGVIEGVPVKVRIRYSL